MITAYCGLPRHGKTYNVVRDVILVALREGRRVVTNIPLVEDAIRAAGGTGEIVQLTNEELEREPEKALAKCTNGSVVVLDEVWRFLPQSKSVKDVSAVWGSLFAEHGHRVDAEGRMMQIVLVVQDLANVAAFARRLVEQTFIVTKLTSVGAASKYRVDVYPGAVTGLNPPRNRRISEQFGTYDKRIFGMYVSRTLSEAGDGVKVNEAALDGRGTAWRHPFVRYVFPVFVLGGLWGIYRVVTFFTGSDTPELPQASVGVVSVPGLRSTGGSGRGPSAELGQRRRIAGILRTSEVSTSRVLLERGGQSRWVPWLAARCMTRAVDDVVVCEWEGETYELGYDWRGRREESRKLGVAEALGFSADARGPSE